MKNDNPLQGKTIWIADDEPGLTDLYQGWFVLKDAMVETFEDPLSLLARLERAKRGEVTMPDLIWTDLNFSGSEAFWDDTKIESHVAGKMIIDQVKDIPIILLTGDDDAFHTLNRGNVTVLTKPVDRYVAVDSAVKAIEEGGGVTYSKRESRRKVNHPLHRVQHKPPQRDDFAYGFIFDDDCKTSAFALSSQDAHCAGVFVPKLGTLGLPDLPS
jgi:DNA-binding NtrC family response regulator